MNSTAPQRRRAALLRLTLTMSLLAQLETAPPRALAESSPWTPAIPTYAWSFPRDHSAHPSHRTEWWYFTGHLTDATGRQYGYQFTFFRIGLTPAEPGDTEAAAASVSTWSATALVLGHAAIGDLEHDEHHFSEVLYRTAPFLGGFPGPPDSLLAWSLGPAGTDARWTLSWNGEGFDFSMRDETKRMAFALTTRATRPLVLQGPSGYSSKGEGAAGEAASQYYSFTRLATEGWIELDGRRLEVEGLSWMDKEFGSSQLGPDQVGWDWFSLQLDDGRDLMLYRLRRSDGSTDTARGTVVPGDPARQPRYLNSQDWSVQSTRSWKSSSTDTDYPARWEIEVRGMAGDAVGEADGNPADEELRLIVEPEMADQENVGRLLGGLFYWEGAVRVLDPNGRRVGQGYVELVGYGRGNRPRI